MPTTNQLVRKGRKGRNRYNRKAKYLKGAPHVRAVVISTGVREPRRPNSAKRKVARVKLITGAEVTAFIPGEGHRIKEHDTVLVRPGGAKDLSVRWEIIRGVRDATSPEDRAKARSKLGAKKR